MEQAKTGEAVARPKPYIPETSDNSVGEIVISSEPYDVARLPSFDGGSCDVLVEWTSRPSNEQQKLIVGGNWT